MRTVLTLARNPLRRADVDASGARRRDGDRLTTALAVLAFAVTSALGLSVLGGLLAFLARAADPVDDVVADLAPTYVVLAATAVVLLVVPLLTLSAAAARLGVARRDARLATLRLLGVTPREVVALTVVETAWQGVAGALVGVVGYGALVPLWTRFSFMGHPLTASEMWVGPGVLLAVVAGVPALAAVSAMVSLRRVVVSPLGVARRQTPPGLRWVRGLAVVVAVGAFAVAVEVSGGLELAVAAALLLGVLAAVFGTLNLLGPWVVGLLGRAMAAAARRPATLLAGRRLVDDPRAAWRVVGGVALASFVAGILSVLPALAATDAGGDPTTELMVDDVVTGGTITLAIAFAVAAVSAGIGQGAGVLDRRRELALQRLAGVPVELFDAVRRREVLAPLVLVTSVSAAVALVVLVPLFGLGQVTDLSGLALLLGCLVTGALLVLGATETSRPLLRSVLRETVVRAD